MDSLQLKETTEGNIDSADRLSAEFARATVQIMIMQFHIDDEDILFLYLFTSSGKIALHRLHDSREQLTVCRDDACDGRSTGGTIGSDKSSNGRV